MPMFVCILLLAPLASLSCSNFAMEDQYGLSVRTEDTSPGHSAGEDFGISLISQPATSRTLGFVGFAAMKHGPTNAPLNASQGIKAGLNSAGLSCDKQSLGNTVFPAPKGDGDIDGALLCRWALEQFPNISSLQQGLAQGANFVAPAHDENFSNGHWALRDAAGDGLVIEFVNGTMNVYEDHNDGGATGFGVMTNSPSFPWQLKNMRFQQWKRSKYNPAISIDGSWYPDARFERLVLVKSAMPKPSSLQTAVALAVHVLNTVSVPSGSQPGKDMDRPEDHRTEFAVIYDHRNSVLYWRSVENQNLQRLRLSDAGLEQGSGQKFLLVKSPRLEWFSDAASELAGSAW